MTMTGRFRAAVRSVNGTGINTTSPWARLGIVPVLVVARVVPEVRGRRGGLGQVVEVLLLLGGEDDDLHARPGRQGDGQLDPARRVDGRLVAECFEGHGTSSRSFGERTQSRKRRTRYRVGPTDHGANSS